MAWWKNTRGSWGKAHERKAEGKAGRQAEDRALIEEGLDEQPFGEDEDAWPVIP